MPRKPKRDSRADHERQPRSGAERRPRARPGGLRIIGGAFRGRRLRYSGDWRIRPMKDRVREAVFNLLGLAVGGKHALDLFAGTGALGFEALSRGAVRATFFEQHFPTADIIRRNAADLGLDDVTEVVAADTFVWFRRAARLPQNPRYQMGWLVFFSPPYDFYVSRRAEMLGLIGTLIDAAPPASLLVVESDQRFDLGELPMPAWWDLREYPPARIGIGRLPEGNRD